MIEKGSDLFTLLLLLLLLFPLARLFIHSPPSFSRNPPLFFFSSSSSSWTPICDLPDHAIIPFQTTSDVHTPYDTKRALAQVHTYYTVPYMHSCLPLGGT